MKEKEVGRVGGRAAHPTNDGLIAPARGLARMLVGWRNRDASAIHGDARSVHKSGI